MKCLKSNNPIDLLELQQGFESNREPSYLLGSNQDWLVNIFELDSKYFIKKISILLI